MEKDGWQRDCATIPVTSPGKIQVCWRMGRQSSEECLSLDGAEVLKAFLATVCRSKACSQVSKYIIMFCKAGTASQQQAWYYLGRLNILQFMRLKRIHFEGARTFLKLLKNLPDVIMRPVFHLSSLAAGNMLMLHSAVQVKQDESVNPRPAILTCILWAPSATCAKDSNGSGKGDVGFPRANWTAFWNERTGCME